MKNINPGQLIQILANIGVLAGLLLLAYELHQNNLFAEQQAAYSRLQESLRMDALVIQPENARLYYRFVGDGPLSPIDQQRRSTLIGGMFEQWEWIHERRPNLIPSEAFRGSWQRSQPMDVWQERKHEYSPAFVKWMEENVIPNGRNQHEYEKK